MGSEMCIRDRVVGHSGSRPCGNSRRGTPTIYTKQLSGHGAGSRCLLYTSDAADERSSVDLGGRRIIKKKTNDAHGTYSSSM